MPQVLQQGESAPERRPHPAVSTSESLMSEELDANESWNGQSERSQDSIPKCKMQSENSQGSAWPFCKVQSENSQSSARHKCRLQSEKSNGAPRSVGAKLDKMSKQLRDLGDMPQQIAALQESLSILSAWLMKDGPPPKLSMLAKATMAAQERTAPSSSGGMTGNHGKRVSMASSLEDCSTSLMGSPSDAGFGPAISKASSSSSLMNHDILSKREHWMSREASSGSLMSRDILGKSTVGRHGYGAHPTLLGRRASIIPGNMHSISSPTGSQASNKVFVGEPEEDTDEDDESSTSSSTVQSVHLARSNTWALSASSEDGDAPKSNVLSFMKLSSTSSIGPFISNPYETGFLLSPCHPARVAWDALMVSVTALLCFAGPIVLVYLDFMTVVCTGSNAATVSFHTADTLLIIDVAMNLCTAYEAEDGRIVSAPKLVAMKYCRTWLLLDVFAAWPSALAPSGFVFGAKGPHMEAVTYVILSVKLLSRGLKLVHLLSRIQNQVRHVTLAPLKVVLALTLCAHSMACIWRQVQRADTARESPLPGMSSNADVQDQYIADVYWVVATMTTVGYGDIYPCGTYGRVYATLCMLMGSVFFGFVMSTVSQVFEHMFKNELEAQLREARNFMHRRRITPELQRRVEFNIQRQLRQEKARVMPPTAFEKLSPSVQQDLALELLRNVLLKFPLFRDAPHAFMAEIARSHVPVQALPGDVVVEEGQLVQELVFVVQGRVLLCERRAAGSNAAEEAAKEKRGSTSSMVTLIPKVPLLPDDEDYDIIEIELEAGAWLGERCLFEEHVRDCTAIAETDAELAVLPRSEYHRIVAKFPRLRIRIQALTERVTNGELSLEDLKYKKPAEAEKCSARRGWGFFSGSPG